MDDPDQHHEDCDYRNSSNAFGRMCPTCDQPVVSFTPEGEVACGSCGYRPEVYDCNLGCGETA